MTEATPSRRRLIIMRVIAWLMAASAVGFGLITIVFGIVDPAQEIHAVHNAVVASVLLVLSAPPLIATALDPARAARPLVILGVVAIASLGTMAAALTLDPFTLPFAILTAVLWAMVPGRSGAIPNGRWSLLMLGMVALGTVPLVLYALGQAGLQRTDDVSEHAAFFHWVETSFYAVAILLVGLVAALRPAAFRMAAVLAGLALAILGAVSLLPEQHASALDAPWSWAAVVGGLAFVGVGAWEARRLGSPPARSEAG